VLSITRGHYQLLQESWAAIIAAVAANGFRFFDLRRGGLQSLLAFCRMARHLGDLAERSGISFAISTIKKQFGEFRRFGLVGMRPKRAEVYFTRFF